MLSAPVAHEDHVSRTCHAALAIMKAIQDYNHKVEGAFDITFQVQIGINSGWVVAGSIGNSLRMDYTADGDTSNLAARLQAVACLREILMVLEMNHQPYLVVY